MSLPSRAMGMLASWMGEGFSQPFSKMPISSSRFRQKSSNSLPFVSRDPSLTEVFFLMSRGGITSFAFQPPSGYTNLMLLVWFIDLSGVWLSEFSATLDIL
ncbi:unnamed protein product, partial [Ixodes pacificus]